MKTAAAGGDSFSFESEQQQHSKTSCLKLRMNLRASRLSCRLNGRKSSAGFVSQPNRFTPSPHFSFHSKLHTLTGFHTAQRAAVTSCLVPRLRLHMHTGWRVMTPISHWAAHYFLHQISKLRDDTTKTNKKQSDVFSVQMKDFQFSGINTKKTEDFCLKIASIFT